MENYRVAYQKFTKTYNVTGAVFIEAENKESVPDLFYQALASRSITDLRKYQIVNIQSPEDIKQVRKRKDLKPVKLSLKIFNLMTDPEEQAFRCSCSNLMHFTKMKMYPGACPYEYFFLCNYCERLYSVRGKTVSFILRETELDFADEWEWLIPYQASIMKTLKKEC